MNQSTAGTGVSYLDLAKSAIEKLKKRRDGRAKQMQREFKSGKRKGKGKRKRQNQQQINVFDPDFDDENDQSSHTDTNQPKQDRYLVCLTRNRYCNSNGIDAKSGNRQVGGMFIHMIDELYDHVGENKAGDSSFNEDGHVLVSWRHTLDDFTHRIKNIVATDLSDLGGAIKAAFDLTNQYRLDCGIDNYGRGRKPWWTDPSVIVVLTDGGDLVVERDSNSTNAHTNTNSNYLRSTHISVDNALILPMKQRHRGGHYNNGSELTIEPFRWDQRLYTIILGMSGQTEAEMNEAEKERVAEMQRQRQRNLGGGGGGGSSEILSLGGEALQSPSGSTQKSGTSISTGTMNTFLELDVLDMYDTESESDKDDTETPARRDNQNDNQAAKTSNKSVSSLTGGKDCNTGAGSGKNNNNSNSSHLLQLPPATKTLTNMSRVTGGQCWVIRNAFELDQRIDELDKAVEGMSRCVMVAFDPRQHLTAPGGLMQDSKGKKAPNTRNSTPLLLKKCPATPLYQYCRPSTGMTSSGRSSSTSVLQLIGGGGRHSTNSSHNNSTGCSDGSSTKKYVWPLPENYALHKRALMSKLPPRSAHPNIRFNGGTFAQDASQRSMEVWHAVVHRLGFPVDEYRLERCAVSDALLNSASTSAKSRQGSSLHSSPLVVNINDAASVAATFPQWRVFAAGSGLSQNQNHRNPNQGVMPTGMNGDAASFGFLTRENYPTMFEDAANYESITHQKDRERQKERASERESMTYSTSKERECALLVVLPYNWPVLFSLLCELIDAQKPKRRNGRTSSKGQTVWHNYGWWVECNANLVRSVKIDWRDRLHRYLAEIPFYYHQPLRQVLQRWQLGSLFPSGSETNAIPVPRIDSCLRSLQESAKSINARRDADARKRKEWLNERVKAAYEERANAKCSYTNKHERMPGSGSIASNKTSTITNDNRRGDNSASAGSSVRSGVSSELGHHALQRHLHQMTVQHRHRRNAATLMKSAVQAARRASRHIHTDNDTDTDMGSSNECDDEIVLPAYLAACLATTGAQSSSGGVAVTSAKRASLGSTWARARNEILLACAVQNDGGGRTNLHSNVHTNANAHANTHDILSPSSFPPAAKLLKLRDGNSTNKVNADANTNTHKKRHLSTDQNSSMDDETASTANSFQTNLSYYSDSDSNFNAVNSNQKANASTSFEWTPHSHAHRGKQRHRRDGHALPLSPSVAAMDLDAFHSKPIAVMGIYNKREAERKSRALRDPTDFSDILHLNTGNQRSNALPNSARNRIVNGRRQFNRRRETLEERNKLAANLRANAQNQNRKNPIHLEGVDEADDEEERLDRETDTEPRNDSDKEKNSHDDAIIPMSPPSLSSAKPLSERVLPPLKLSPPTIPIIGSGSIESGSGSGSESAVQLCTPQSPRTMKAKSLVSRCKRAFTITDTHEAIWSGLRELIKEGKEVNNGEGERKRKRANGGDVTQYLLTFSGTYLENAAFSAAASEWALENGRPDLAPVLQTSPVFRAVADPFK